MSAITSKELQRLYTAKLKESSLTPQDAKKLNLKTLTASQVGALGLPAYAGFMLPYHNIKGSVSNFYRIRYLQETRKGIELHSNKKPLRYIQPQDTINEVYLPPLVKWEPILKDPTQRIYITEGELKSACATKYGMPTIGLGGVWNWRAKWNLLSHLPFFDCVTWQDREVYIVFDSDSVSNPLVQQAQNALCVELMRLGATPLVLELPPKGDAKMGLDDFIVAHGAGYVEDYILQNSEYYDQIKSLKELNSKVVYVRNPGLVLRLENAQRIACRAFVDHAFSDLQYTEESVGANGDVKTIVKSAPREWLKWKGRAVVEELVYAPGEEEFVSGKYNIWTGWGVEPHRGSVKPFKELLDFLFGDEVEARTWFEQWLAYPLQYPGTKLYSACLLWSVTQGVGKSLIGHTMFEIYGENATEIGEEELHSGSNNWAENKQFIMGDEIIAGDSRKRNVAEKLKGMITRQKIWIDIKYIPTYSILDCLNYYLTSNHPDAVYMDDKDRRMFIQEISATEPLPMEFYNEYKKWLSVDGAAALFHYLLKLDTSGFDPKAPPPVTRSKIEMIHLSRSEVSSWVAALRDDPNGVLMSSGEPRPQALWSSEELLTLYDPMGKTRLTVNGLSRELKKAGVQKALNGTPITVYGRQKRLWVIRPNQDIARIKSGVKLAAYYEEERKPKTTKFKKR